MKAIKQIIDYLFDSGALSVQQLRQLAAAGFVPREEVFPGEHEPWGRGADWAPDEEDDYEAAGRPHAGHRRHAPPPREGALSADGLGALLARRAAAWAPRLAALLPLARRLGDADDWAQAAVVLRKADPEALTRAVAAGLAAQAPPFDALWRAIALDDYLSAAREPGTHGPAVNAYRALLAAGGHVTLGRYAALLKVEEVAHVLNLKQAQRALLCACECVLTGQPELIAAGLRRHHDSPAYWPLVLLYTARRGSAGARPVPSGDECHPPRACPDGAAWARAWAHAVQMGPREVPPFLVEYTALPVRRPRAVCAAAWGVLATFEPWVVEMLDLFYRADAAPPYLAARANVPEAEVRHLLASSRAAVRRALEAHPELAVPMLAEPTWGWDNFVDDWLRWHFGPAGRQARAAGAADAEPDGELAELVGRYFGPSADLLCPKSWN